MSVARRQKAARTRNAGKWTEARYWGTLRSALRNWAKWWHPASLAKQSARVSIGRYKCEVCGKDTPGKDIQVDHIIPCGTLRSLEDVARFIQLLTPESPNAFQVLCLDCHQKKTNLERSQRKEK
jgi:5-methylcytosine-specific restriction endonuclease McrA